MSLAIPLSSFCGGRRIGRREGYRSDDSRSGVGKEE
jgi:hypothetical protein